MWCLNTDCVLQARAGLVSSVEVLKLAQAYKSETNYTVWSDLSSNLSTFSILTQYTDYNDLFLNYQIKLFSDVAGRLGWEKEEDESKRAILFRKFVDLFSLN